MSYAILLAAIGVFFIVAAAVYGIMHVALYYVDNNYPRKGGGGA